MMTFQVSKRPSVRPFLPPILEVSHAGGTRMMSSSIAMKRTNIVCNRRSTASLHSQDDPMRRPLLLLLLTVSTSVLCRSYVIQPGTWNFQGRYPIAYEQVKPVFDESEEGGPIVTEEEHAPPLLLLNGFGVGSFHQHKLIQQLMSLSTTAEGNANGLSATTDRTIYTMDYLGQGKSWPEDCNDGYGPSEQGLRYCGQTWVNQITEFIEHAILKNDDSSNNKRRKVHICGNSVGGHLAVCVAAARPDLVESLVLLNATPVWGLNLPGWSGHLPPPAVPHRIGRYLFDRIRDLTTIEQYLANAYANVEAFDETLMRQIRSCTEGDGGHAAFASIMWSPPITVQLKQQQQQQNRDMHEQEEGANFYQCLRALECDVLLAFGKDDPWCKPAFAKRMLQDLKQRRPSDSVDRYVELTHVGHCPNHEAPIAVARILSRWLDPTVPSRSSNDLHLAADSEEVQEAWGRTILSERQEEEIPLSLMDRIAVAFV